MSMIERARALRRTIERMAENLTDEEAVENTELYPAWGPEGHEYIPGDRVRYNGELYKVLQAHTSQDTWAPDVSPSLFARVLSGQDGEVGVWEQPDSTNPYMKGDKVHYPAATDPVYESTIDNNIWSPGAYPQGWKQI